MWTLIYIFLADRMIKIYTRKKYFVHSYTIISSNRMFVTIIENS